MQWNVFATMILIFTGLNGCASIELARQLPASLKPSNARERRKVVHEEVSRRRL